MAVCILAMLFIGVGMVSTIMPKYLTLVSIHKPLGIAILVLALVRLAVRLRCRAPPLPADLPEPMKLAAYLSHYALYALMIGMPLIGWAMLSAAGYPVVLFGNIWLAADPAAERRGFMRCSGAHISILPSRSSRSSCCMSLRHCSMRWCAGTGCSRPWLQCRRATRSVQLSRMGAYTSRETGG